MTQEDKELLLKDVCARLPYNVWVSYKTKYDDIERATILNGNYVRDIIEGTSSWIDFKPYLRPLSSMTEEEKRELQSFFPGSFGNQWLDVEAGYIDIYECESTTRLYLYDANRLIDWLNKKMFDFRGLIPRGHALSTEAFNPY